MQYETCRHVKVDGAYCGSPSIKNHKYCYYHLQERGRRLRRARALRDNVPYRLEIPPLVDFDAVEFALTEIAQAVGSGQLDHRAAGKMLYAIQQATSLIKYRAKLAAAQSEAMHDAKQPAQADKPRIQEYPNFEQEFGLNPGTDIDAETEWTERKAEEEAELRHANDFPPPPPGMRIGSAQFRVYREEAYQALNMRLNHMKHDLKEYYEEKRKRGEEQFKKEMASVASSAGPVSRGA